MLNDILHKIIEMKMDETRSFKLTDDMFLFVENWVTHDKECMTAIELNEGYEDSNGDHILEGVIQCSVCDFRNKEQISNALEYYIRLATSRLV